MFSQTSTRSSGPRAGTSLPARRWVAGLTLIGRAESVASTIGRVISAMVGGLLIALGLRSLLNIPDPDAQAPD